MANELTPVLGLIKPVVGGDVDLWGEMLNTNSDTIDAAMGSVEAELLVLQTDIAKAQFPAGTRLLFQQSAAPTGWTKDTTQHDKALRVVNGSVGTGGLIAFSAAFSAHSISGTTNQVATTGTVGDTTLTIDQIPPHTHGVGVSNTYSQGGNNPAPGTGTTRVSTSAGNGLPHNHPFTGSSHAHTTSSNLDLSVQYVDVIIAVKN